METIGIILDGFTALRSEPSSSSEMISSLVFGEQYHVRSSEGDWLNIENLSDGYTGWLSLSNHNPCVKEQAVVVFDATGTLQKGDSSETIHLGPGCYVVDGDEEFELAGHLFKWISRESGKTRDVYAIASKLLGTPYLWGGRSIYAIDCSGFSQMIYRALGIEIPRDSRPQSEISSERLSYEELSYGDLAFFVDDKNKVNHVGIVLESEKIIHASGSVHVDHMKPDGIYNKKEKRTHLFAWGIKKPEV